ncbi:pseudaminic acid biosynthesis-associated methylase [Gemmatimonadota bacterium]
MNPYNTPQEEFWAGSFGNDYTDRNAGTALLASNTALFEKILTLTGSITSVLELGANIGLNLRAIRNLQPQVSLTAIEINKKAADELRRIDRITVHTDSILEFETDEQWDLVFTKGVLIHISPEQLPRIYDLIHRCSRRYICLMEYYNPKPVSVPYRGNQDRLFKRDFAGEVLDTYSDLSLVDYGFIYHRDPEAPQDDISWFLLEKPA